MTQSISTLGLGARSEKFTRASTALPPMAAEYQSALQLFNCRVQLTARFQVATFDGDTPKESRPGKLHDVCYSAQFDVIYTVVRANSSVIFTNFVSHSFKERKTV